jgi:hypothetical protein
MIRMSSSATADHCPFLNRCDGRCGQFLSVNRLGHAFARCFGQYRACPVYAELLWERRHRSTAGQLKQLTAHAGTLVAQAVEPRAKAA